MSVGRESGAGVRDGAGRAVGVLLSLGALSLLPGCPNPNLYATPRTVEPGKVAHSIATESWAVRGDRLQSSDVNVLPQVPTYTARVGVSERVDVGLRLANGWAFAGDVKFLLAKGSVDLAIAPGGQVFAFPSSKSGSSSSSSDRDGAFVGYLHLPLIVGFNASESLTVVATGGISAGAQAWGTTKSGSSDDAAEAWLQRGVLGRAGLGMNVRFSKSFAVQPEITFLQSFRDNQTTMIGGFGFNWGALPSFD